jgi:hypothetical protein
MSNLKTFTGSVKYNESADSNKYIIWDSASVKESELAISKGARPKISPFWEGNIDWRKGDIVYSYSEEEWNELKKCKDDIIYFATKYVQLKTPDGYANVELRDYQKKLLLHFHENKESIVLAPRQVGKCIAGETRVIILYDGKIIKFLKRLISIISQYLKINK